MDPMAEARALQSSFRASGSHRGENSPGGRGAPRRRGGGGGSGGGRGGHGGGRGDHGGGRGGGRGGGGRGGYHNVAPNSGLPPSRRPQPSPLSRPPAGLPPPVNFGGSRQPSATRPAPTRTRVPDTPMFAPDPTFAPVLGGAPSATAQAPTQAPTSSQVRDQFAAIVGGQAAPKVPVQAAPRVPVQAAPRVPVQAAPKVPAQAAPKVPAQAAPKVPAQVFAQASIAKASAVQIAPMPPVQTTFKVSTKPEIYREIPARQMRESHVPSQSVINVPAQAAAVVDAHARERCDRIATKLAAVVDAQAARKVSTQAAPKIHAQVAANAPTLAPASTDNRGPLKPPAVRGVQQVPRLSASFQDHKDVSSSHVESLTTRNFSEIPEKSVFPPGDGGGFPTQVKIPSIDSRLEHTPSIAGSLLGPRSTEALVRAEPPRPIGTSRSDLTGGPIVMYYQDETPQPVVKRSAASSDATSGALRQQEPPQPKPKVPTPTAGGPIVMYYQDENPRPEVKRSVASSDAAAGTRHQQEPPQPKPKDNTPAAAVEPAFKGYYQDGDFTLPVASSDAKAGTLHQQEPPRPKPKVNTPAARVNPLFNGYYQGESFTLESKTGASVDSGETRIIANQNDPLRANDSSHFDMMDTTPYQPQTITSNQSGNILQTQVVRSSDTNSSQPTVNTYYQGSNYTRGAGGGQSSGTDDFMDVDEEPTITGYPTLEAANTQQTTGKKCTCPKKTTAGLGTSRWAAPAFKEADPISVTCPVHHPGLRVDLSTPTTASFPPTVSSLSPTASSFVPRSEIIHVPPGNSQAASASTENVLNGHTNDGISRPAGGPPGPNEAWLL